VLICNWPKRRGLAANLEILLCVYLSLERPGDMPEGSAPGSCVGSGAFVLPVAKTHRRDRILSSVESNSAASRFD
jgi:hypothetical protein